LLQIAIANAGLLARNQGDVVYFCRRNAQTAVHRALHATHAVRPVKLTDSGALAARKPGNVSLQIGWAAVHFTCARASETTMPGPWTGHRREN
jgi:hypothetical protein